MVSYIEFEGPNGSSQPLLVEVDEGETVSQRGGIQKAGLREVASKTIAMAQTSFEDAIQFAIRSNAQVFLTAILSLSPLPSEAEITFGLKITGEAGNVAVGKVGGETNYNVRLTWKREAKGT